MRKTILVFAVAMLAFAAVPVSQAAPIAPLPAGASTAHSNVVQAYYWRGHRWGHRRCWRGAYGRYHRRYW